MFKQLRGPERLFRFGQLTVAVVFFYFLIKVGGSVIADLPKFSQTPKLCDFLNHAQIHEHQAVIDLTKKKLNVISKSGDQVSVQLKRSHEDYLKNKKSFDNWRATRLSTESQEQNPELVARAKKLDEQLANQQRLEAQLQDIAQNKQILTKSMSFAQDGINKLNKEASKKYTNAINSANIKFFLIRLAFVGPILFLALCLFRYFRKSIHWPFVWGFIFLHCLNSFSN